MLFGIALFGLGDDAASDAWRRTARRSAGDRVNDDGRAAVAEDGMVVAAQSHVRSNHGGMSCAIRCHDQRKIRNVSQRKRGAVLWVRTAKVRPRRLEVRCFALPDLVDVQRMLAGWQVLDVQFDLDAMLRCSQDGGSHALPLGVLDIHGDGLGCGVTLGVLRSGGTQRKEK